MNTENRKIVGDKLNDVFCGKTSSLYFATHEDFGNRPSNLFADNPFKNHSLEDSIILCLDYMRHYCSYNEDNVCETSPARNRSIVDIWRHLKFYNPELTIYEVMNCAYESVRKKGRISSFICPDIRRRVFILDDTRWYLNDLDFKDFFGITFTAWKDI